MTSDLSGLHLTCLGPPPLPLPEETLRRRPGKPAATGLFRVLGLALCVASSACDADPAPDDQAAIAAAVQQLEIPADLVSAEAAFERNCALCHGERALGTPQGPPLVHIIYEPSHHADIAFHLAASRGVRAHHWSFGDMPPLPHVTQEEIEAIIAYVRHLQRSVGIT